MSIQAWGLILSGALCVGVIAIALQARREVGRVRSAERRSLAERAEIASMISHEVRGPVATIRGLTSTTSINYDRLTDAERLEFLGLIDQESLRLLSVVDQTSIALKVDAGTVTFHMSAVSVKDLVDAAVGKTELGSHPLTLEIQSGLTVKCDAKWTEIALVQLLDNATKFSPPAAPIEVSARADSRSVIIDVLDHGPGIPEDRREASFKKFAQWRPAGYEQQPGSGLGLYICRTLVAEQQGEVVIAEAEAGGSMLRIRFPLREGSIGG